MALLNATVFAPCEWCGEYDFDEPLISVEKGKLTLCTECYFFEYCEPCQLCDYLMEPDEMDDRMVAIVNELDWEGAPGV